MSWSRWFIIIFVVAFAISGLADEILTLSGHEEADIPGGTWVEYWPVFATLANVVIILGAKLLGGRFLLRRPDFYGAPEEDGR